MKILFVTGLIALILGVLSLVVPLPNRQREGVKVGGLSIGVETQSEEKVSPIVSAALILGGIGMVVAGKKAA